MKTDKFTQKFKVGGGELKKSVKIEKIIAGRECRMHQNKCFSFYLFFRCQCESYNVSGYLPCFFLNFNLIPTFKFKFNLIISHSMQISNQKVLAKMTQQRNYKINKYNSKRRDFKGFLNVFHSQVLTRVNKHIVLIKFYTQT